MLASHVPTLTPPNCWRFAPRTPRRSPHEGHGLGGAIVDRKQREGLAEWGSPDAVGIGLLHAHPRLASPKTEEYSPARRGETGSEPPVSGVRRPTPGQDPQGCLGSLARRVGEESVQDEERPYVRPE